jgi:hypothetical protein
MAVWSLLKVGALALIAIPRATAQGPGYVSETVYPSRAFD